MNRIVALGMLSVYLYSLTSVGGVLVQKVNEVEFRTKTVTFTIDDCKNAVEKLTEKTKHCLIEFDQPLLNENETVISGERVFHYTSADGYQVAIRDVVMAEGIQLYVDYDYFRNRDGHRDIFETAGDQFVDLVGKIPGIKQPFTHIEELFSRPTTPDGVVTRTFQTRRFIK